MTKLEKLKALQSKYETAEKRMHEFTDGFFGQEMLSSYLAAKTPLINALMENREALIAVAEAAKKIDWPNVCLKNYEERILVNVLQDAPWSLNKDAEK